VVYTWLVGGRTTSDQVIERSGELFRLDSGAARRRTSVIGDDEPRRVDEQSLEASMDYLAAPPRPGPALPGRHSSVDALTIHLACTVSCLLNRSIDDPAPSDGGSRA